MASLARMSNVLRGTVARSVRAASATPSVASALLRTPRRGFANRFNRRVPSASAPGAVAVRSAELAPVAAAPAPAGVKIEGDEAQVAQVRLRPHQTFKVDPSSLISVPQGVEVRAVYGAPQPQMQQQHQYQQQQEQPSGVGGFLSRLRTATPPQQQQQQQPLATAPVLAEVALQVGQQMPADSVQLGPATAAKLHTLNLDDFGGEMYIARGAFLAAPSSVNLHNVAEPTGIPGLVLQRIDGVGSVVLKVSGQPIERQLGPGEQLYAQANRLVAVESTVQVRGGDGLLLTLTGPGRVLLQSLPSLEVALSQQAEQTQQILQSNGIQAPAGMQSTGFAMGPMGGAGMGLGGMIMQGMAFGVGSSIAHHAIGSMFGGGHGAASAAPEQVPPAAAPEQEMQDDLSGSGNGGGDDGSFFGGMFGGEDDGGDDGGDGDW